MATAAARMERYRARQRTGRIIVPVEIDDVIVIDALILAGLLAEDARDDRVAIGRAIEALISVTMREARDA
jgi:hypothetical protein